jgi:putative SOS response-associated peptidase YedK
MTDQPPLEVAAAAHDRCIIHLRQENVETWLTPKGRTLKQLDKILNDSNGRTMSTGWPPKNGHGTMEIVDSKAD